MRFCRAAAYQRRLANRRPLTRLAELAGLSPSGARLIADGGTDCPDGRGDSLYPLEERVGVRGRHWGFSTFEQHALNRYCTRLPLNGPGSPKAMHSLIELNGAAHARSRHDPLLAILDRAIRPLKRSPLQRILLVTDGTVTEILEAYTGESMRLIKLLETVVTLDEPQRALNLEAGERVLRRQILLQGKMTLTTYTYAESYIAVDRLEEPLRRALLESHKPIGFLIQEQRMETFREILACGRELAGPIAQHFEVDPSHGMIWRTYRVFYRGEPIMQITEKFPESHFVD